MRRIIQFDEEIFTLRDLTPQEQDALYQEFKDSYEKATGAAWDQNTFQWKASNWTFYGDRDKGGIAVRVQRSGLVKLNAAFGNIRSILTGFKELMAHKSNDPVWGVMTKNLVDAVVRISGGEFKEPPKKLVQILIPRISHIFGDQIKRVEKDGAIVVDTVAGEMKKYFIANKTYYRWMIDNMDKGNMNIPKPMMALIKGLLKMIV